MRRKDVTVALGTLLFVWLCAATTADAVPPCSMIGYSDCNANCQILGRGSCTSWSLGACQNSSAQYHYYCQSGPSIDGWCSGCSGGGGGGCFLAGTQITMADGSTKPIEEIRAGDVVLAFDEVSGAMKPDKVVRVHDPVEAEFHLVVNGTLQVTPSHRVRTGDDWMEIGRLKIGDTLTGADGRAVPITSIERVDGKVKVYNFAVNPYETYVANGIVVHNKKPPVEEEPPPGGGLN